jgi:hypothetical protein
MDTYRDKKVVGVFVRFRAPLHPGSHGQNFSFDLSCRQGTSTLLNK